MHLPSRHMSNSWECWSPQERETTWLLKRELTFTAFLPCEQDKKGTIVGRELFTLFSLSVLLNYKSKAETPKPWLKNAHLPPTWARCYAWKCTNLIMNSYKMWEVSITFFLNKNEEMQRGYNTQGYMVFFWQSRGQIRVLQTQKLMLFLGHCTNE